MADIADDTIIVAGASQGMGRSMAERFSEEGAHVVVVARNKEKLQTVADGMAGQTLVEPGDVTDNRDVTRIVDATISEFGCIQTVVMSAGTGLMSSKNESPKLAGVEKAEWDQILATNVTGPFLFTKAVLPQMITQGHGNIINISSGLGRDVYLVGPSAWTPYTVSKWALESLTKVTAIEYGHDGINANTLDPGGRVDTKFWDHLPEEERREIMQPDVMNEAAVRLAAQGPDGVSGEGRNATAWEEFLPK